MVLHTLYKLHATCGAQYRGSTSRPALDSLVASDMYEAVKVSTQVKSQRRQIRLPSDLHRQMAQVLMVYLVLISFIIFYCH